MPEDRHPASQPSPTPLEPADAALIDAVRTPVDDAQAHLDLAGLAAQVDASMALLESVARAGLLLPHHVDADGVPRYSEADAAAVRAGLELLDAGLPLAELLALAAPTDAAVRDIADRAVDAFLRFVRDPALGAGSDGDEQLGERLIAAYERMLPATERLVAHHLRRRLVLAALARLAEDADAARPSGS